MKTCFFSMLLFVISFSANASFDNALEKHCLLRNGAIFKKNVRIDSFGLATIINGTQYGFNIKTEDNLFLVIMKDQEVDWDRNQFASTARMAKVLNLPVNICVDNENGGYLLGIEIL